MRILYLYPHQMGDEFSLVQKGESPSDRMYGLIELRKLGHEVDFSDGRFEGQLGKLVKWLRRNIGLNFCDLKTLMKITKYDVIIMKDDFSTVITVTCRLLNIKIVYLDALFVFPQRWWKILACRINLRLADGIIAYSTKQIDLWSKKFDFDPKKLKTLPYTIDVSFYKAPLCDINCTRPYILTVGRDMGRDFGTLVESMKGLGMGLKIVTLPYTLKNVNVVHSWIEVLNNIPYKDMFRLYAGAMLVVIPLKRNAVMYPSGIRGMLEAMALSKALICSYSPVLEEYAKEGEGVIYVEPENIAALRGKLQDLLSNPQRLAELGKKGKDKVRDNYNMDAFAIPFEQYVCGFICRAMQRKTHPPLANSDTK